METSKSTDKKPKDYGTVFWQLLLGRSTISAMVQINMSRSLTARTAWLLLFLMGLALAIYQSVTLVTAYLRFSVNEKQSMVLQVPLPIPAVTVCSNTPVNWKSDEVKELFNISGRLAAKGIEDMEDLDYETSEDVHDDILMKLADLNETKQASLGLDFSEYMIACAYPSEKDNCSEILNLQIHNLFFGNCITFDANRHPNNTKKSSIQSGFYLMAFVVNTYEEFTNLFRDPAIVVTLHESGTPPILKLENIIKIYPGEFMEIRVSQKEYTRLPWPYASECIKSDNPLAQWKSLNHNEEHPYLYTMQACRDSCLQNLSINYCNCINPTLGIRGNMSQVEELCYYGCNDIPADEVTKMCDCRESCKYMEFSYLVQRNPTKFKEGTFLKQFLKGIFGRNTTVPPEKLTLVKKMVIFTVSTSSNFATVVKEEPAITPADLGGAIGGVFGLWIGLSAMSLLEFFAAFNATFLTCLTRFWNKMHKNDTRPQAHSNLPSNINMAFDSNENDN